MTNTDATSVTFGPISDYCIRPSADPLMALQGDPSSGKQYLLGAAVGECICAASKP